MDLILGVVLPHDDLIQDGRHQSSVDAFFKTQFLVQFPADGFNIQFFRTCLRLFLPDGSQLGFLTLQLIVETIVALLEFGYGDGTGNVQIQQPILLLLGGFDAALHLSDHSFIIHLFGNIDQHRHQ